MNYRIQIVGDDELPQGMCAVIVEMEEGPPLMLINGGPARAWSLMRAYEDAREPCTVPSILEPLRLVSRLGFPIDGASGWQALARSAV